MGNAQKDMCRAYYDGAPGVFVSGVVWLLSGIIASIVSFQTGMLSLFFGGMIIYPVSIVFCKLLGRSGKAHKGNFLATLAVQSTFPLVILFPLAYLVSLVNLEWFFPAMLLIIGCRYLLFVTIYGLNVYWIFGFLLILSGFILALYKMNFVIGAFSGGVIEVLFAAIVFAGASK
ncbi:MAG: DUF7010 family protein [Cellvibrionaceae bacterium]